MSSSSYSDDDGTRPVSAPQGHSRLRRSQHLRRPSLDLVHKLLDKLYVKKNSKPKSSRVERRSSSSTQGDGFGINRRECLNWSLLTQHFLEGKSHKEMYRHAKHLIPPVQGLEKKNVIVHHGNTSKVMTNMEWLGRPVAVKTCEDISVENNLQILYEAILHIRVQQTYHRMGRKCRVPEIHAIRWLTSKSLCIIMQCFDTNLSTLELHNTKQITVAILNEIRWIRDNANVSHFDTHCKNIGVYKDDEWCIYDWGMGALRSPYRPVQIDTFLVPTLPKSDTFDEAIFVKSMHDFMNLKSFAKPWLKDMKKTLKNSSKQQWKMDTPVLFDYTCYIVDNIKGGTAKLCSHDGSKSIMADVSSIKLHFAHPHVIYYFHHIEFNNVWDYID